MFETKLIAGWGDMDFNSHMRNTAYLDKSADTRMLYFAHCGISMADFARRRIGPIVRKDELEYFREFHLLDEVRVQLTLAGLSEDGSRMVLRNAFYRGDVLAARVTSTGGWFDLNVRKLVAPPQDILQALQDLGRTEDFLSLPNLRTDAA